MDKNVIDAVNQVISFDDSCLYASITGSHLHGTANYTSDIDVKVIYKPSRADMLLGNQPKYLHTEHEVTVNNHQTKLDIVYIPVHEFLKKLVKMEINALELFYSIGSHGTLHSTEFSSSVRQG